MGGSEKKKCKWQGVKGASPDPGGGEVMLLKRGIISPNMETRDAVTKGINFGTY